MFSCSYSLSVLGVTIADLLVLFKGRKTEVHGQVKLYTISKLMGCTRFTFLLVSPWEQVAQKEKHWWWVRKWQKRLLLAQYEPSSPKVNTWVRVVNVTKNNHRMTLKSLHRINDKTAMRKTEMGPTQRTIRQLFCTY